MASWIPVQVVEIPAHCPHFLPIQVMRPFHLPPQPLTPQSFEIYTLPVNSRLIGDGDGMTVHVDVAQPMEWQSLPAVVMQAFVARSLARASYDYDRADALHDFIVGAGYRAIKRPNKQEILVKEYRVRLRGIDAPEMGMEYGEEAKDALRNLIGGKSLRLVVYGKDPYDRLVADVYCGANFIQELLLKHGHAWHYAFFDERPQLAQWQAQARAWRKGLWANPNPQAPWDYKRKERRRKK